MSETSVYDVVIAGSGLGGLLTAVLLAKEGLKVAVLEKNKQIGGCLQTYAVQKKVFDSCVHYIGGLGDGDTLNRIFRYAGIMDKLELKQLDPLGYDRITFGQSAVTYPLACGDTPFIEQLLPYFPNERKALEDYLQLVKEVAACFPMYHLKPGDAAAKEKVIHWELTQKLDQITSNTLLKQVLTGNSLLYAGARGKTPFYLHALVTESYRHSAHKVIPGSSMISKYLWQELQQLGGEVIRNTTVTDLVAEDGKIAYAQSAAGTRFYARHFIAAIHPALLEDLLDPGLLRPAFHKRMAQLEQTSSSFCLNLVLKPGSIKYLPHNLYWHATTDALAAIDEGAADWPQTYALYYGEDENNKGFADTLSVLTYLPYDCYQQWQNTFNHTGDPQFRGDAYQTFKEEQAVLLLNRLSARFPEIKENIVAQSISTPLTYRDYTGTVNGSLYGIAKDVNNTAATTISIRTRVPNLYLTGQNINLHGVLGVSITALMTAAELTGSSMENLLEKVNKA